MRGCTVAWAQPGEHQSLVSLLSYPRSGPVPPSQCEDASRSYVVAAPDHADATFCHTVPPSPAQIHPPPKLNVFKPETWTEATFADRRKDIEAVFDALLTDAEFKDVIDTANIGVSGHSLGGYTVVGMQEAGAAGSIIASARF